MFYIVFLVSNYIALGVGVWIAMRHGEILRHQSEQNSTKYEDTFYSPLEKPLMEQEIEPVEESVISETDIDRFDLGGIHDAETNQSPEAQTPEIVDRESDDNDRSLYNKMPLSPSHRLIEQLVGMTRHDEPDELVSIASQLQEILEMTTGADDNYYASEDAEFFVTPDEEQYATTAICRPMVGRKKL